MCLLTHLLSASGWGIRADTTICRMMLCRCCTLATISARLASYSAQALSKAAFSSAISSANLHTMHNMLAVNS